MDILIIADFCGSFDGKTNNRFAYLAEKLAKEHNVEIVTSDFFHGSKKHFTELKNNFPYKVTMLHECEYKKNVSIKRFYSHFLWGKAVGKYIKERETPDVVYCAVPTLTAAYEAAKYCKNNTVKFIVDIQDLWPESFRMVFNMPIISDIIFLPMKFMADQIYRGADEIIAVSDTYCQRAKSVNMKVQETHAVFLGTDLSKFDDNVKNNLLLRDDDEIWLGYCGTLGHSYDLRCAIDAIELLNKQGTRNIKFVIMGEGPLRKEFENYALKKKINAEFTGRLPYDEMCGRLSACDIVINCISKGSAASIINKHADYAASGNAVINTQESKEYRKLVEMYNMGLNCENGDAGDVAEKMFILIRDNEMRTKMGENARICAEEKFDRNITYKKMLQKINL